VTSGRRLLRRGATAAATGLALQYVPSTVTLGQWSSLEALPAGLCRWRGPRKPEVALTFDDGPSAEATPLFLDRLDALGLVGTFFCLGSLVERAPDLAGEVARRGHQLETHGYHHEHHLGRSPRWVWRDLVAARAAMRALGHDPTWYRPSYGQATGSTLLAAKALGLRTVLWSAWGREWTTTDPGAVAGLVARRLDPGAIVLFHDNDAFGTPGMWRVGLKALDQVAAEIERRSLRAVTLDELCS
jgi:peptidoglycan/xylan/chitin deacetylase (PgdA/CDA1 family)